MRFLPCLCCPISSVLSLEFLDGISLSTRPWGFMVSTVIIQVSISGIYDKLFTIWLWILIVAFIQFCSNLFKLDPFRDHNAVPLTIFFPHIFFFFLPIVIIFTFRFLLWQIKTFSKEWKTIYSEITLLTQQSKGVHGSQDLQCWAEPDAHAQVCCVYKLDLYTQCPSVLCVYI